MNLLFCTFFMHILLLRIFIGICLFEKFEKRSYKIKKKIDKYM